MRWKKIHCKYSLFKNVLRQLLFLEIVSVRKIKKQTVQMYVYKVMVGVNLIDELLRKPRGGGGADCLRRVFNPLKNWTLTIIYCFDKVLSLYLRLGRFNYTQTPGSCHSSSQLILTNNSEHYQLDKSESRTAIIDI